jgi:hypothetical protein
LREPLVPLGIDGSKIEREEPHFGYEHTSFHAALEQKTWKGQPDDPNDRYRSTQRSRIKKLLKTSCLHPPNINNLLFVEYFWGLTSLLWSEKRQAYFSSFSVAEKPGQLSPFISTGAMLIWLLWNKIKFRDSLHNLHKILFCGYLSGSWGKCHRISKKGHLIPIIFRSPLLDRCVFPISNGIPP